MEFIDRIKLLLGDRTLYGWVSKSLKLDTGLARRINEGTLPKKDSFWNAVRNRENVRDEWLRTGEGAPFYVYSGLSDEDWADSLLPLVEAASRNEFEFSGIWYIYCDHRLTTVLYANAEKQFPDQSAAMPYIAMRIQTGQFGPRTALALKQLQTVLPDLPQALEVTSDLFQRLATGKIGAYELFGDPETGGGLFAQACDWQRNHYLQPVSMPAEHLSGEETALLDCFRGLTPARRKSLLAFIREWVD